MKMPKGATIIGKSKKDRYSKCQNEKDKDKMTFKDLQNTSPLKPRMNSDTQEGKQFLLH
jgi:hypothetical protein